MQRFYLPNPDIRQDVLSITDPRIVFQCFKVLRMKQGSRLCVFDGADHEWMVEVVEIDKRELTVQILEAVKRDTESKLEVHLYQALPKKPALFELVIQKATELGVQHIYPLITRRTERQHLSKFDRLSMIAIESVEQSGRTRIPTIHHAVNFEEAIKTKHAYVAYEFEEKTPLTHYLPEIQKAGVVHLFIGPEGGFDQKEIDYAIEKGAKAFTMGPRILRTETAAIAAVSVVMI